MGLRLRGTEIKIGVTDFGGLFDGEADKATDSDIEIVIVAEDVMDIDLTTDDVIDKLAYCECEIEAYIDRDALGDTEKEGEKEIEAAFD